jgi:hypothetical protein
MFYLGGLYGNDRRQSLTDVGDYADPVDGLNKVNSIGVNLSDQLSKSFSITASYNYTRKKNTTDGFSQLTSSYVGNTIRRKEDYVLNTVDDSHNFKFALSGAFANRDQLKIDGNFLFNTQETFNTKNTEITNAQMSNRGTNEGTTRLTTPNGDLDAVYSK